MTKNINDILGKAFGEFKDTPTPTSEQKEKMLKAVLVQASLKETLHGVNKVYSLFFEYPWRFSFGVSIIQAVVFTLIFGSRYTNILIQSFAR